MRHKRHELRPLKTQLQLRPTQSKYMYPTFGKRLSLVSNRCQVEIYAPTASFTKRYQTLRSDGVTIPKSAIVECTIVVQMWSRKSHHRGMLTPDHTGYNIVQHASSIVSHRSSYPAALASSVRERTSCRDTRLPMH